MQTKKKQVRPVRHHEPKGDIPSVITFQRELSMEDPREEFKIQSVASGSMEGEPEVDEIQALHTALCYLCSINADVSEVESFCLFFPMALNFEGAATHLPEENARFIVEQQMRRCQCFSPTCHENRRRVLQVIHLGFEYFQERHYSEAPLPKNPSWGMYLDELIKLEQEIRTLRLEEIELRNHLLTKSVEMRACQDELNQFQKYDAQNKSTLSMLVCTRNPKLDERRNKLEYQVGVASLNRASVEREHQDVLRHIQDRRRFEFAVLRNAFHGCRRHVCEPAPNLAQPAPY